MVVHNDEEIQQVLKQIPLPVEIRPRMIPYHNTIAQTEHELTVMVSAGLRLSPVKEVEVEQLMSKSGDPLSSL